MGSWGRGYGTARGTDQATLDCLSTQLLGLATEAGRHCPAADPVAGLAGDQLVLEPRSDWPKE